MGKIEGVQREVILPAEKSNRPLRVLQLLPDSTRTHRHTLRMRDADALIFECI